MKLLKEANKKIVELIAIKDDLSDHQLEEVLKDLKKEKQSNVRKG